MTETRNRYAINNTRILKLINICTKDVQDWGFKLPKEITWYAANCKRRLGLASYSTNSITLSKFLFNETKDDNIKNTIYHELAHLIAGPRTHHGPAWQKVAKVISVKSGLNITKLAETANYEYFNSQAYKDLYKYVFKCTKCGCTLKYQKKTNFVDTYNEMITVGGIQKHRWTCSCCGGHFERVK